MKREGTAERFWAKVDRRSDAECWPWIRALDKDGYGCFQISTGRKALAHRIAYILVNGAIPPGHVIDHRCYVRDCVNPAHLEAVTAEENRRRERRPLKAQCPKGHPYDLTNTYIFPGPGRVCRKCRACNEEASRIYRSRKKLRQIS